MPQAIAFGPGDERDAAASLLGQLVRAARIYRRLMIDLLGEAR